MYENFEGAKWEVINNSLTSEDIKTYAFQMLSALNACHSQQVIHSCVNPRNLLIDKKKRLLKLTGWENAVIHEHNSSYQTDRNSHYFRSPELLLNFQV